MNTAQAARHRRVLVVATSLGHTSGGGAAFLMGLIEGLTTVDDVDVVVAGSAEHLPRRLTRYAGTSIDFIEVPAVSGSARLAVDSYVALRARKWGANVVHYPHDWCPPSRCPVVMTIQNIAPFEPRSAGDMGLRGRALRRLSKGTAAQAAAVVAVSETGRRVWDRAVPSAPATDVIPEGFTAPFAGRPILEGGTSSRMPTGDFVLAITGPAPYKNARLTLSTMLRHTTDDPEATWVVAGIPEGSWHDGRQRVGVGSLDRDALLGFMAAARCVVFLSEVESFGLPALEAIAMGTRPIVLEGTAMAEWMGCRCSVVSGSESAVIRAIRAVPRRHGSREEEVAPISSRFDWHNIAQEYAAVYRRVVGS